MNINCILESIFETIALIGANFPNALSNNNIKKLYQPFTIHKHLFHYTTVQGLFGIIESQCFWLTNMQYMNDLSESSHATKLIKKMLTELSKNNKYTNDFSKYLKKANCIDLDNSKNYIACFTTNGDSLPMWNMYGKNCGVAIEIDLDAGYSFCEQGCFFRDMIYDEKILYDYIEKIVDFYQETYNKLKEDKSNNCHTINNTMNEILKKIILFSANVKNKYFSHEAETRLLLTVKDCDKIKYRVKNNIIVSYIETSSHQLNKDKKLPIKSVIVGPGEEQDIVKSSIMDFLKSKGYNIEVKSSTIPYRDR